MFNPDEGFVEELERISPRLGIEFNPNAGKFWIFERVRIPVKHGKFNGGTLTSIEEQKFPVTTIETDSGGFRYPTLRDLDDVRRRDMARRAAHSQRMELRDHLRKQKEAYPKFVREQTEAIVRDVLPTALRGRMSFTARSNA